MLEGIKGYYQAMTIEELTEHLKSIGLEFKDKNANKFEHFTDDELYILKRQAMESSWEICGCGAYSEYEVKLHEKLMNEIADEIKRREI